MSCISPESEKGFYYKGNNTGVLLIHGFTGTPSEVRLLGEFLRDKGYTVRGILLKGHGTTPEDMKRSNCRDWIHGAVEGYKSLKRDCDEVFAVGFSMGGLLSLYLARNYDIKGAAALSAPIRIQRSKAVFYYIKKIFMAHIISDKREIRTNGYWRAPLISVYNLFKLIRYIKANLKHIEKPVLIVQSYEDKTVHPISANIIYNNLGSKDKSIIYLHKSGHVITCGNEKEQVFREVYNFIKTKSVLRREKNSNETGQMSPTIGGEHISPAKSFYKEEM